MDLWLPVPVARKSFVVRHQRRDSSSVRWLVGDKETGIPGQLGPALLIFLGKSVVKLRPPTPKELQSQFPRWLGLSIKLFGLEFEVLKKMARESCGSAFTHSNDTNVRAAQQKHLELWQSPLEGQRSDKSGAASAKHEHALDWPTEHA